MINNLGPLVSGRMHAYTIHIPAALNVSNIILSSTQNSATFTAGQNLVGLYQGNALIASSADLTATWQGAGAIQLSCPLVGAPVSVSAGLVTVALLANFSAGNFTVGAWSPALTFMNTGLSAPNLRNMIQTGLTSLPANLNSTTGTVTVPFAVLSS